MSRELPLWEDDESDVKIEYRLQFGHALVPRLDIGGVLKNIQSIFKLGKSLSFSNSIENLPRDTKTGATILNENDFWHFIFADMETNIVIFAPHMLFHNSSNWIKLSQKLKDTLAVINQGDLNLFHYSIFTKGKLVCNAAIDQTGLHESVVRPIEAYLNGKLIYKHEEEKGRFNEEIRNFISKDVIIDIDENGKVRFKKLLSKNDYIEPIQVCHVVFKTTVIV
jgi:hypothetical protein